MRPPVIALMLVLAALPCAAQATDGATGAGETNAAPYGGSREAWRLMNAQAEYESQKKNPWLAFAGELVLPGLGNHYAGETGDALLTWTGFLIGATFLLNGHGVFCEWISDGACEKNQYEIVSGWMFLVGSELFALTSAPLNVLRNNRALRARLGLENDITMAWVPARMGSGHGLLLRLTY